MIFLAVYAILTTLEPMIIPDDSNLTKLNIQNNIGSFILALIFYFIIIFLDILIGESIYILYKPKNKKKAFITAIFRWLYSGIVIFALFMLIFGQFSLYNDLILIAYIFFILHLFYWGILTYRAYYIPKIFAFLLITASFAYIITNYGDLILSENIFSILNDIAMIPASLAEISLGIWLLIKAKYVEEKIEEKYS